MWGGKEGLECNTFRLVLGDCRALHNVGTMCCWLFTWPQWLVSVQTPQDLVAAEHPANVSWSIMIADERIGTLTRVMCELYLLPVVVTVSGGQLVSSAKVFLTHWDV